MRQILILIALTVGASACFFGPPDPLAEGAPNFAVTEVMEGEPVGPLPEALSHSLQPCVSQPELEELRPLFGPDGVALFSDGDRILHVQVEPVPEGILRNRDQGKSSVMACTIR